MGSRNLVAAALALFALLAGCAAPETPDEWTAERRTDPDPATDLSQRLCDDVEAAALGSLAHHTDLDPVLDELAAIAAVTGATSALPVIDDLRSGPADPEVWAEMTTVLDAATFDRCGVPVVAAMDLTADGSPGWLPCFAAEADGYVPVDCGTGETLEVADADWVPATR